MIFLSFVFSLNTIGDLLENPVENLSNCESNDTIKEYSLYAATICKNTSKRLLKNLSDFK